MAFDNIVAFANKIKEEVKDAYIKHSDIRPAFFIVTKDDVHRVYPEDIPNSPNAFRALLEKMEMIAFVAKYEMKENYIHFWGDLFPQVGDDVIGVFAKDKETHHMIAVPINEFIDYRKMAEDGKPYREMKFKEERVFAGNQYKELFDTMFNEVMSFATR